MPLLAVTPQVEFDPDNPEHILEYVRRERGLPATRPRINFNYHAPFQDSMSYIRWKMAASYVRLMAAMNPGILNDLSLLENVDISQYRVEPFTKKDVGPGGVLGVGRVVAGNKPVLQLYRRSEAERVSGVEYRGPNGKVIA